MFEKNSGEKIFRATRNNNSIPESSCNNPGFNLKFLYSDLLVDMNGIGIIKNGYCQVAQNSPEQKPELPYPGKSIELEIFLHSYIELFKRLLQNT